MNTVERRVPRRFGRGWPERDVMELLEAAEERRKTFPESSLEEMLPGAGWHRRVFRAVVACEAPGPPGPVFRRLAEAVEGYEFSDPSIVRGYFRPDGALLGRRMLLELRTLGFRFLCPVVVSRVRREGDARRSVVGFRYDTLEGHVEDGAEWFLLTKDHATGRIVFSIDARWRSGELPTWWMRLGFPVLAPRAQRLWHRRAHARLHALAEDASARPDGGRPGGGLRSAGPRLASARRVDGGGRRSHRTSRGVGTGTAAAALGALTGVRATASLYTLARHLAPVGPPVGSHPGAEPRALAGRGRKGRSRGPGRRLAGAGEPTGASTLERWLSRPAAGPAVFLALAGEMAADKWPRIPARTSLPALAGRLMVAGAAGWTLARHHRRPPLRAALLAAANAGVSAAGVTALRRRAGRKIPGPLLGLAEDAVVLAGAEALARRLATPLPVVEGGESPPEAAGLDRG